jgi:hypothetical protein
MRDQTPIRAGEGVKGAGNVQPPDPVVDGMLLRENREHMASMRSSIANMLSQCAAMEFEERTCLPPPRPPGGARQVEDVHLQSQEAAHILDAAGI